jgi:predicted membrane protein
MNNPNGYDPQNFREQIRNEAHEAARQAREAARRAHGEWRQRHGAQMVAGATAPIIGSLILILVGVMLLASQTGYFSFDTLWRLWPLVFVIAGANKMIEDRGRHWIGSTFLILFGGLLLLHSFGRFPFNIFQLWPLLLIGLGLELLWHIWTRPVIGDFTPEEGASSLQRIDSVNIFGGIDSHIANPEFRGGKVVAIFGGFKLDLTRCDFTCEAIKLEATAIFGGGEIIVPMHWNVVMNGVGIMGGYTDGTRHVPLPAGMPQRTIHIEGAAIFGGVEVKN